MRPLFRQGRLLTTRDGLIPRTIFRLPRPQIQCSRAQHSASTSDETRLPRFAQPSIWQSIIPRFLRERHTSRSATTKRHTNPANYFIWIYILIGSQAIRLLSLKNEFRTYTRQSDLKLAKLREVVEKLQRGEEVDVEKVLGTGDEIAEREWEEALRELESEERIWQNNSRKRREQREKEENERQSASPVNESEESVLSKSEEVVSRPAMVPHAPGFY